MYMHKYMYGERGEWGKMDHRFGVQERGIEDASLFCPVVPFCLALLYTRVYTHLGTRNYCVARPDPSKQPRN